MKTLLLLSSSSFFENDLSKILGKPLSKYKIAHIITASRGKGVQNLSYLDKTRNRLTELKCQFEDLDIAGKTEDELRAILRNFDGVFVNGGSTFYLLKCIRESGFNKVIKELLPKGFIYIGASAGSYVLCPTIEMATWKHQDKYYHYEITDYTAMNLVPFLVSVHYIPEYRDILKEKISKTKYPVKILNDRQAVLVKDNQITLLGGKEIKL